MRFFTKLTAGTLVCASLSLTFAGADDRPAKREKIVARLDVALGKIAADLDGVVDQQSTAKIDDALAQLDPMDADVKALSDLNTDRDEDQDQRIDALTWGNDLSNLRHALTSLEILKKDQLASHPLPKQCATADAQLEQHIRELVAQPEKGAKRADDLRERAASNKKTWFAKVDAADDVEVDDRDAWRQAAGFARDEGAWKPVQKRLENGGNDLFAIDERFNEDVHAACDDLAAGADDPDVQLALDELAQPRSSSTDRSLDDLTSDAGQWIEARDAFASEYHDHLEEIRQEICEDYQQHVEDHVRAESTAITRASGAWAVLQGRADLLVTRLGAQKGDKAKQLAASIGKARASLDDAAKRGLFLGWDDPKIRTHAEYDEKHHAEMRKACSASEVHLAGGTIDCVEIGGTAAQPSCTLVEIVPNNDKSTSAAQNQLADERMWFEEHTASSIPQDSVLRKCIGADGKLSITDYQVRTYDNCPRYEELDELGGQTP
jgi:hypothetical protein